MTLVPYDDRDGVIWMDGKLVPWREANIHVLTHGLHYGSCVFEGERAYNGRIFKLTEHTERLVHSAQILGFDLPYSVAEIDAACMETLAANNLTDAYVRPVAWRGSEMMGVSAQQSRIRVAIATWYWGSYFSEEAKKTGIKLTLSKWRRPAPDTAPTSAKAAGLYMICTLSKHEAERNGFQDALMLDYRGYIAEATGANFFMVERGRIYTPIPDCFLDGITRRTIMELAKKRGIEVIETRLKLEDLRNADEVFLTGTAAEVTPVGSIDDYSFTPGAVTHQLAEDYANLVRGQ